MNSINTKSIQLATPSDAEPPPSAMPEETRYARAVVAALTAGSVLGAGVQEASAEVVWHNSQTTEKLPITTVGVTEVVDPATGEPVATSQPVIWFDFLTGQVELGAASPVVHPDPFTHQFAVSRLGDIAGALANGEGIERQFLAEVGVVTFSYVWPRRLAAGEVIGNAEDFLEGGGGIHTLAQQGWEEVVGLWRFGENEPPVDGYLGMRFSDDGGTTYKNGWAHIVLAADYNLTLIEFAYETEPGVAIRVPTPAETFQASTDAWRKKHFTPADLANPALEATLWGDPADPDHDGQPNLLEMVFGTDPDERDTTEVLAIEVAPPSATLVYRRSKAFPAAFLQVEWSSDLKTWSSANIVQTVREDLGRAERVAAEFMPSEPTDRVFLRLRVGP